MTSGASSCSMYSVRDGNAEAGSSFFDNLDQLEGERLLVLQPLRPAGGFGEAIDEKIDRAVIEGIDMHEQSCFRRFGEGFVCEQIGFDFFANIGAIARLKSGTQHR